MKKIIIAFDGMHFAEPAMHFAASLHAHSPVHVTGVFLNSVDYTALWAFPIIPGAPGVTIPTESAEDEAALQANIRKFEEVCHRLDIPFNVHDDSGGLVFEEIKKESRFADLALICSELFYNNLGKQPNDYLKTILQMIECPVFIVPDSTYFPQSVVLTYDGSESSVFAIKQFAYLFPELCKGKTWLLFAGEEADALPDQVNIGELVLRHYTDLTMDTLHNKPGTHLQEWLNQHGNPLVVTGAFGRTGISQLFKKSFLTELIQKHQTPLFIAHK
ncbi:MAG: hypothetical protein U0T56_07950 [Ferruginibacter sp.]|jgi:nucleotide-binding universal stress UspA family protein